MEKRIYETYNEKKYTDNYWGITRSQKKWFSNYTKAKILERWIVRLKNREVLLDAGGGVGNWAAYFKDCFKKVIVLDISKKALERIPEKDIIKNTVLFLIFL